MKRKNTIYYIILITLIIISIYQISIFKFTNQGGWIFLSRIWAVVIFVIIFWSKKEFTNEPWLKRKHKNNQKNNILETENSFNYKDNPSIKDKLNHKVLPKIKNINSQNFDLVYHEPLGGDLTLTFVQDINERITYILKSEEKQLKYLINEWKKNISETKFELFTSEEWDGLVYFNEPNDFSNEKIFDTKFIDSCCEKLNTDKIIFSISRRHRMQITDYHNSFNELERFFYSHFSVWRDTSLPDETISEYVLIGSKSEGIISIVHLGFRMNLYEKNGQRLLSYSTYGDEIIGDKINFSKIIENRKENFEFK